MRQRLQAFARSLRVPAPAGGMSPLERAAGYGLLSIAGTLFGFLTGSELRDGAPPMLFDVVEQAVSSVVPSLFSGLGLAGRVVTGALLGGVPDVVLDRLVLRPRAFDPAASGWHVLWNTLVFVLLPWLDPPGRLAVRGWAAPRGRGVERAAGALFYLAYVLLLAVAIPVIVLVAGVLAGRNELELGGNEQVGLEVVVVAAIAALMLWRLKGNAGVTLFGRRVAWPGVALAWLATGAAWGWPTHVAGGAVMGLAASLTGTGATPARRQAGQAGLAALGLYNIGQLWLGFADVGGWERFVGRPLQHHAAVAAVVIVWLALFGLGCWLARAGAALRLHRALLGTGLLVLGFWLLVEVAVLGVVWRFGEVDPRPLWLQVGQWSEVVAQARAWQSDVWGTLKAAPGDGLAPMLAGLWPFGFVVLSLADRAAARGQRSWVATAAMAAPVLAGCVVLPGLLVNVVAKASGLLAISYAAPYVGGGTALAVAWWMWGQRRPRRPALPSLPVGAGGSALPHEVAAAVEAMRRGQP